MLRLITPPSIEPVTLAEAKAHLRLEISDDDALVSDLIGTARELIEEEVARSLITTAWGLTLDQFAYGWTSGVPVPARGRHRQFHRRLRGDRSRRAEAGQVGDRAAGRAPLREPRGDRHQLDRAARGAARGPGDGRQARLGILPLMGRYSIPL